MWLAIKIFILKVLIFFELCWEASDTWEKIVMVIGILCGVLLVGSLVGEFW